jgi:hypothetical protein
MPNPIRISLVTAFAIAGVAAFGQSFDQTCPTPQFPSATALGIDSKCGTSGTGEKADATQDQKKNNFCATGPMRPISFDELQSLQASVEANKKINFGNPMGGKAPLSSKPGATTDRKPLDALGEGQLRSIEGFILIARQEGPESVNCGAEFPKGKANDAFHDIHISLVKDEESTHGDECESVVVEMSPHHRPELWSAASLKKVAGKHARVRATGQLFFDSSHTRCVDGARVGSDPARFTNWEIHPIYKFEVCQSGDCTVAKNWLSLEDWLKQN